MSGDAPSTPDFGAFLIHDGRVILEGASDELVNDPIARKYYLGEDFKM